MHLLNRAGAAMNELEGRAVAEGRASSRSISRSPALPPGEYVLEIKTGDQDGDATELRRLPRHRLTAMRALVAVLLVAAQGSAALRTSPRLVTVDVAVTDARGRALTDLKPADFELREGGALLPLESVRLVRAAAGAAGRSRRPRSSRPPTSGWPPARTKRGCSRSSSTSTTSPAAPTPTASATR